MKSLFASLLLLSSLSSQAAFTIGAYNIRNFDYDVRSRVQTNKNELAKMIKSLNVDVLSVEEIGNTGRFEDFVDKQFPTYATDLSRCGGAHGQHVGFMYNTNTVELLAFEEDMRVTNPGSRPECDGGSRPLAIGTFKIKATGQRFFAITAHLKSGSNNESMAKRFKQYEIIRTVVKEMQSKTGIKDFFIAGDLNTTEYLSKGGDFRALNKVISDLSAKHLTANLACSAYWWGGTDDGIEEPSLLDHIITSPGLLKSNATVRAHGHCQKVSCRSASLEALGISYNQVSDHCPLTATIQ